MRRRPSVAHVAMDPAQVKLVVFYVRDHRPLGRWDVDVLRHHPHVSKISGIVAIAIALFLDRLRNDAPLPGAELERRKFAQLLIPHENIERTLSEADVWFQPLCVIVPRLFSPTHVGHLVCY